MMTSPLLFQPLRFVAVALVHAAILGPAASGFAAPSLASDAPVGAASEDGANPMGASGDCQAATAKGASYCRASKLYEESRFDEAAAELVPLCRSTKPLPSAVPFALAQCRRFLGQFASAFHYYSLEILAYEIAAKTAEPNKEEREWHSQTVRELRWLTPRLARVTIELGREAAVDQVRVDDKPASRVPNEMRRGLERAIGPEARLEEKGFLASLENGLVEDPESVASLGAQLLEQAPSAALPGPLNTARLILILDRTQEHTVEFTRTVDGREHRTRLTVAKQKPSQAGTTIELAKMDATVTFTVKGGASHGTELLLTPTRDSVLVSPIPVWEQGGTLVPHGSYRVSARTKENLVPEPEPKHLSLLPADVGNVEVELKPAPVPWYRKTWVLVTGGAVIGGVVGAIIYFSSQSSRRDVNSGSLGWTIVVPPP
jgi:hypothetical protein